MAKVVYCPCGVVIREADEPVLIQRAQAHARESHRLELTPTQVLAMARPE